MLAPDRIGYGRTPGEARGLADNADLVAAVHPGPGDRAGHRGRPQLGGRGGRLLAVRHPDMVKSLVLVGAACTPDSLNGLDQWLNAPGVGDALTVAGLVGIGEVLPRSGTWPAMPRRPPATSWLRSCPTTG